jgi:hypothetical protein
VFGVDRYALVLAYYHALSDLQRVLLFQRPKKYELAINLVPLIMQMTANEVIE